MAPTDSEALRRTAVAASNVSGPPAAELRALTLVTRKRRLKQNQKAKEFMATTIPTKVRGRKCCGNNFGRVR